MFHLLGSHTPPEMAKERAYTVVRGEARRVVEC